MSRKGLIDDLVSGESHPVPGRRGGRLRPRQRARRARPGAIPAVAQPRARPGARARHHGVRPGRRAARTRAAASRISSATSTARSTARGPTSSAVVHSHSPAVIPFGVTGHAAAADLPHERLPRGGDADLRDPRGGRPGDRHADPRPQARRRARARRSAWRAFALMRGHGSVAVGGDAQAGGLPRDLRGGQRAPAGGGRAARRRSPFSTTPRPQRAPAPSTA